MSQRELLEEHLLAYNTPIDVEPASNALAELLYTASETGLIENISSTDAVTIWKIVTAALSIDVETLQKLRM